MNQFHMWGQVLEVVHLHPDETGTAWSLGDVDSLATFQKSTFENVSKRSGAGIFASNGVRIRVR
jgi:hypothetical protein